MKGEITLRRQRNLYLVDSENVGNSWVDIIHNLKGSDKIYVFYTSKSAHLEISQVHMIKDKLDKVEFIECNNGSKNALDFQLVSLMGSMIATAQKTIYTIVSNDTGFNSLIHFWHKRGVKVERRSVSEVLIKQSFSSCKVEVLDNAIAEACGKHIGKEILESIIVILDTNKQDRNAIYKGLNSKFSADGIQYYRAIKNVLDDYYRN